MTVNGCIVCMCAFSRVGSLPWFAAHEFVNQSINRSIAGEEGRGGEREGRERERA